MTERTIDLDALAEELRAAGWGVDETIGGGIIFRKPTDDEDIDDIHVTNDGTLYWHDKVDWSALDIIRRHVSPTPGAPAVDVVTIPADLAARAADALEMVSREPSNWVASVNQPKADAESIRAALEGQPIPDLHANLLDIFNANTTHYGAGNATCSDFDGVAAADAILQLLGYPAVERPTREATPVEDGEMPW